MCFDVPFHGIRLRLSSRVFLQSAIVVAVLWVWVGRNAVSMGAPTFSTQRGFAFGDAHDDVRFSDPRYAGCWLPTYEQTRDTKPVYGGEVEKDKLTWGCGVEAVRRHPTGMPYLVGVKLARLASPVFETPNVRGAPGACHRGAC